MGATMASFLWPLVCVGAEVARDGQPHLVSVVAGIVLLPANILVLMTVIWTFEVRHYQRCTLESQMPNARVQNRAYAIGLHQGIAVATLLGVAYMVVGPMPLYSVAPGVLACVSLATWAFKYDLTSDVISIQIQAATKLGN